MSNYIDVAVIIPCKDEETTIFKVVNDFNNSLPGCTVYIYDNNSTDNTIETARKAGAIIGYEKRRGKGNVVRRMFSEIDAEIYLMVDGDDTYDASVAPQLVFAIRNNNDMAVGTRSGALEIHERKGHALGNQFFNNAFRVLLGREYSDIFSGYRGFSRRFVKSFPALSSGFEIETELSAHASQLRLPVLEIPTIYSNRPEGSESKLSTFKDGIRILITIVVLVKEYRPLYFFSIFGLVGIALSVALFLPVFFDYIEDSNTSLIPTAVLSTGIVVISILSITCGVILDSIMRFRSEIKRILYNSIS